MSNNQGLKKKIAQMPNLPGVYLLKDDLGHIIYCGKAGSLKKRVASYLRSTPDPNPRRGLLVCAIRDVEYIVTGSELEALILESNLIKKHRPRFNVLLRDDKHYPHLCLTLNEPYPKLKEVRRAKKDGCVYFGPYSPARAMRQTVRLILKIFPLRRCKGTLPKTPKRPCLNYQMGLCCAPCAGFISQEKYQGLIQEVILFLQGKKDDLVRMLKKEMAEAAAGQRYEHAAILRDQIRSIEDCLEKQHVFSASFEDQDYFAFARDQDRACVQVFFIRFGRLTGRKALRLSGVKDTPDDELMAAILEQFYGSDKPVPPGILVETLPSEVDLLQNLLSQKRGGKVRIQAPQRGDKKRLILMAQKNAALDLKSELTDQEKLIEALLSQVQTDLHLPHLPRRIEGFDISNLGPSEAVGSMVCWQDAKPLKSQYRKYRIKDIEGIDDYGMIVEVIRRRFTRLINQKNDIPDLVLIDGGKGHLNAGINALVELGLPDIPTISLAKKEELVYLPEKQGPLDLPARSPTLQLLQRIRDEAHRFAITYQRQRRTRKAFSSSLDEIPGIGPKRRERLLKHFSGLHEIKEASEEKLAAVPGIDRNTARRVFEYFHPDE